MENLPEIFSPLSDSVEQQPRELCYGIGIEHSKSEYGMIAGPVKDLYELLEEVGDFSHVIIRFNPDHSTDILYSWDIEKEAWVLQKV